MTQKPPDQDRPPDAKRRFFDLLRQGAHALQEKRVARAVELLEEAYQMAPEDPNAALNLGGAYILAKKFDQAVEVLQALSQRDPHNPMVWTNLGAAHLGNPVLAGDEQHAGAITAFEQALQLDPDTPNVAYNLGLIYYDRRESEQALYWFRRALQTDPTDQDAQSYIDRLTQTGDERDERGNETI
jgi:tetratricopeptide (TPR) repeat protein